MRVAARGFRLSGGTGCTQIVYPVPAGYFSRTVALSCRARIRSLASNVGIASAAKLFHCSTVIYLGSCALHTSAMLMNARTSSSSSMLAQCYILASRITAVFSAEHTWYTQHTHTTMQRQQQCVICLEAASVRHCTACPWCFTAAGPGYDGFMHTACLAAWRPGTCPLCRRSLRCAQAAAAHLAAVLLCITMALCAEWLLWVLYLQRAPSHGTAVYTAVTMACLAARRGVTSPYSSNPIQLRIAWMVTYAVREEACAALKWPVVFRVMRTFFKAYETPEWQTAHDGLLLVTCEIGVLALCTRTLQM